MQLHLSTGPELYNNFKTLLHGDATSKWNAVVTETGTITAPHFKECVNKMTSYIFPEDALSTQQSYLSNNAKKTKQHTWRQYDVRLHEENNNLKRYPPMFNEQQMLPDAVLRAMVHRTAPQYFQEQIKTQGFEVQTKTTKDVIKFFKTRCEKVYRARIAQQKQRKEQVRCKKGAPAKHDRSRSKGNAKWCTHCKNPTHGTENCGFLKRARADKQREGHKDSKKVKFYKAKSMTKDDIKEFHQFNTMYNKWQQHKNRTHEHHQVEMNNDDAFDKALAELEQYANNMFTDSNKKVDDDNNDDDNDQELDDVGSVVKEDDE